VHVPQAGLQISPISYVRENSSFLFNCVLVHFRDHEKTSKSPFLPICRRTVDILNRHRRHEMYFGCRRTFRSLYVCSKCVPVVNGESRRFVRFHRKRVFPSETGADIGCSPIST
jgi:hypothetical protein